MAAKKPIENYLNGERELPFEELFLVSEKKPFYKTASDRAAKYIVLPLATITTFTGVPNWDAPKHTPKQSVKQDGIVYVQKESPKGIADFLKQAEAWAEDGIVVYIEDFKVRVPSASEFDTYANQGEAATSLLRNALRKRGVKVVTRTDKIKKDTIVIKGEYVYQMNDTETQSLPDYDPTQTPDTITVSIEFDKDGESIGPRIYRKCQDPHYSGSMVDSLAYEAVGYLRGLSNEKNPSPPGKTETLNSDAPDWFQDLVNSVRQKKSSFK
jgi:hypothetical protein